MYYLSTCTVFIFVLLKIVEMSEVQNIWAHAPGASPGGQPGIFNTKIPSAVTFGVGILLFFLPFVDIKCNSMTLQKVTGVELATGFEIKGPGSDDSLVGDFEKIDNKKIEADVREGKNDPNVFALVALALGVIAFVLCLFDSKRVLTIAVIAGALGMAALIGAMIDIKRKVQVEIPEIMGGPSGSARVGNDMYISIDFTAWFYIATLAFIAATWFCFRRMQAIK